MQTVSIGQRSVKMLSQSRYELEIFLVATFGSCTSLFATIFLALTGPDGWAARKPEVFATAGATMAGCALALLGIRAMLQPIAKAGEVLAAYRRDRTVLHFECTTNNSAGRLLSNAMGLVAEIEQTVASDGRLALSDVSAELLNRKYIEMSMSERFDLYASKHEYNCLALVEIDQFKHIREEFRAIMSDAIMTTFVDVLHKATEGKHIISKLAGAQFALMFVETPEEQVEAVCRQVRRLSKQRHIFSFAVTVSIGVAQRESGEAMMQTFSRAETALDDAKRSGRNRVIHATAQA